MAYQPEAMATVSVNNNGVLYVGREARDELGRPGYNNRVRVTIPREDDDDITVEGCLNDAHQICVGISVYRALGGERKSTEPCDTIRTNGIVELASRTWDEANDMTKNRYDDFPTLDCK
jgi:hypothetical protein